MYILNIKNRRLYIWLNNKKCLWCPLSKTQTRLLALLSDRELHTGENISLFMWGKPKKRPTVTRAIASLREKLDVNVKNNCGYWIDEEIYIE